MYVLRILSLGVLMFVGVCCGAFELQDTIHALIEENIHLHDQLENLTSALRELRRFLLRHSNGNDNERDVNSQQFWQEWSKYGISPETHVHLEHALCGHELHASAPSTIENLFLMLIFSFVTQLLI